MCAKLPFQRFFNLLLFINLYTSSRPPFKGIALNLDLFFG